MGETKIIDIADLIKKCEAIYPRFKAAAALEKSGIAAAMSSERFYKFADIRAGMSCSGATPCSMSAACNFLTAGVKTGIVEKDTAGPNYRLREYEESRKTAEACLSNRQTEILKRYPFCRAERLVNSVLRSDVVFNYLSDGERCLSEIQEATKLSQSAASLKMSRLVESDWVDRRRDGKKIYFSLSDQTRRALAALDVAL